MISVVQDVARRILDIIGTIYRLRTEYDGRLCFHRCLSVNGGGGQGVPQEGNVLTQVCPSVCPWGRGYHQGTYPPGIGQRIEYLIRRGRYASCVHAGGLSC